MTPDAKRTMSSMLGISAYLGPKYIDYDAVDNSKIFYIEGYMVTSDENFSAVTSVLKNINSENTMKALSLSDAGIVHGFKDKFKEPVSIISTDAGGVKRATTFAKHLEAYVGFVHKKRDPKIHNVVEAFTVIGEVEDRHAILVDDIIDTGGTIAAAAKILKEKGAKTVSVVATHGIFSDLSVENLSLIHI